MLPITHSSEINPQILQLIDVAQSKSGVASSLQASFDPRHRRHEVRRH
jgi:hypothetical protein